MGRPPKDHRLIVEAIVWLDRIGAPWRDLPAEYGPWATVASRFTGGAGGACGTKCWRRCRPRRTRGGSWTGWAPVDPDLPGDREGLDRSRGGYSTKLHLRVEGRGRPMVVLATAGQRHEAPMLRKLMETGAVKRPSRGRPRIRLDAVAGDKGYSHPSLRRDLRRRGIRAVIPSKSNQPRQRSFDKAAYRQRNRVERSINRLKGWRRVATRYEKREANYLAMVTIAAIVLLWLG